MRPLVQATIRQTVFINVVFVILTVAGVFSLLTSPLENMPKVLQLISYGIPLRYFLNIIRVLLLKGVGISYITEDVIAMTLFSILIMGAAALRFRKRLD